MALAHVRRRPEGEQEADIDWMPHDPVEQRRPEDGKAGWCATPCRPNLGQSEQVEVVVPADAKVICFIGPTDAVTSSPFYESPLQTAVEPSCKGSLIRQTRLPQPVHIRNDVLVSTKWKTFPQI